MLIKASIPKIKTKNKILYSSVPNKGEKYFKISASPFATAASDNIAVPNQNKLLAINPGKGPNAVSI